MWNSLFDLGQFTCPAQNHSFLLCNERAPTLLPSGGSCEGSIHLFMCSFTLQMSETSLNTSVSARFKI